MKTSLSLRQRVMYKAWNLIKEEGFTFRRALKFAWTVVKRAEFKKLLSQTVVKVTFTKVNGETTTRLATRSAEFIPAEYAPKGEGNRNEGVITFFSMNDGGWRSLKAENLIRYRVA